MARSQLSEAVSDLRHRGAARAFELWAPDFRNVIEPVMQRYFEMSYTEIVDRLAGRIEAAMPAAVLEVGCGVGFVVAELARRLAPSARVHGIDLVPAMVRRATALAAESGLGDKLHFQVGAAERLPFPDESFDVVFSSLCFHHLRGGPALEEQVRVLRPGGRLVVFDIGALDVWRTVRGWLFYNLVTRVRYLTIPALRDEFWAVHRTQREWRAFLESFGLEIVAIEDWSRRTGKPSVEKLLLGKYLAYTSKGTPPLFYVECIKR